METNITWWWYSVVVKYSHAGRSSELSMEPLSRSAPSNVISTLQGLLQFTFWSWFTCIWLSMKQHQNFLEQNHYPHYGTLSQQIHLCSVWSNPPRACTKLRWGWYFNVDLHYLYSPYFCSCMSCLVKSNMRYLVMLEAYPLRKDQPYGYRCKRGIRES